MNELKYLADEHGVTHPHFYPLFAQPTSSGFFGLSERTAEASFTGMGNNNILIRMLWTSIFVIAQFLGVTVREHLLYCPDDILVKRVFIAE